MKTDNELPLIGISGAVQCLLEHGSVKGNRISPRPLRSQVLKADGASRGLVAKCMHYPGGKVNPGCPGKTRKENIGRSWRSEEHPIRRRIRFSSTFSQNSEE
ncbi:hypothetical protein K0M31_010069 [Melipona bicolor]|uniref:Uncharacterized protein n=1 Tax=Melipona bicolor TaxID=60889 RepID=A0AA40FMQ5_9HYME|nr:hypothetical protein K0M31_010069 [Melipona bicolor]